MDRRVIDGAIAEAVSASVEQGVKGKELTPFLLDKVKNLTGGDSLESNIRLVYNNARVAALTAAELCRI